MDATFLKGEKLEVSQLNCSFGEFTLSICVTSPLLLTASEQPRYFSLMHLRSDLWIVVIWRQPIRAHHTRWTQHEF